MKKAIYNWVYIYNYVSKLIDKQEIARSVRRLLLNGKVVDSIRHVRSFSFVWRLGMLDVTSRLRLCRSYIYGFAGGVIMTRLLIFFGFLLMDGDIHSIWLQDHQDYCFE